MKRFGILAGFLLSGAAGFGLAAALGIGGERTTATRLSPDETLRASLVQPGSKPVARAIQVRIEDLRTGRETVLFRSTDEGQPSGSERLIWSNDGSRLLVVGRHFFVKDDLFLDNGDQLYFLHHLPSGKSWSNAATEATIPPLRADQVRGLEFTEPVVLKGD